MARVCLDPGHAGGNIDPGAVNSVTGLREADVNLAIAKRVKGYLEVAGLKVLMTRTREVEPQTDSLGYRSDLANRWGADIVLSLHCNSAVNSKAGGTEIYTTKGVTLGDILATCIISQVTAALPELKLRADWDDGDPDKEQNFYILRYTDAPAALFEVAFISNKEEAARLADPAWQDKLSRAVARAVTDYFLL